MDYIPDPGVTEEQKRKISRAFDEEQRQERFELETRRGEKITVSVGDEDTVEFSVFGERVKPDYELPWFGWVLTQTHGLTLAQARRLCLGLSAARLSPPPEYDILEEFFIKVTRWSRVEVHREPFQGLVLISVVEEKTSTDERGNDYYGDIVVSVQLTWDEAIQVAQALSAAAWREPEVTYE